jgi:hypothetical protein
MRPMSADRLLSFAVPTMMLVTPFLATARQIHHLWRAEVAIGVVLLAVLGSLLGLLVARGGVIRTLTLGPLLAITADLMLEGRSFRGGALLEPLAGLPVAVEPLATALLFFAALTICWLLQRHLLEVLAAGFAVTLLSTLLLPVAATSRPREMVGGDRSAAGRQPLVLHLALDEHIGVEGLQADIPGGEELRQWLLSFYRQFGFRVYSRSYSHYTETSNSLPNLVNFAVSDRKNALAEQLGPAENARYRVVRNDYFQQLRQRGYRIHVYESEYLEFCSGTVDLIADCYGYPSWGFDAWRNDIPVGGRFRVLASGYVNRSLVYFTVKNTLYSRLRGTFPALPEWAWERRRNSPLNSMLTLRRLRRDLADAAPGNVYFAHLLLPHHPFIFDAACRVRHPREWQPETRERAYSLYFEQIRCLYSQIGALLTDMSNSGHLNGSIVLIHGDHGPRLAVPRGSAEWRRQDFLDMYSTAFAVKGPNVQPAEDPSFRSISELFTEFWTGRSETRAEPFVFIQRDTKAQLERRSLIPLVTDSTPSR